MGGHEQPSGAPAASIGESTTSTSSSSISTAMDSGDDDSTGSRVVFKDAKAFEAKRQRLVADGTKNLQIISGAWCTLRIRIMKASCFAHTCCRCRCCRFCCYASESISSVSFAFSVFVCFPSSGVNIAPEAKKSRVLQQFLHNC